MFSSYKNKESIILENRQIRAEFIPEPGGKMVSLINKITGYEFLVQRPSSIYRDQPFDGLYIDGECSGYDDMFPTIDECDYKNDPWKGIKMADHGEVWSLPWDYEITNNSLKLNVNGVRFPYDLEKTIYFTAENSLRLDYVLTNNSNYDFEFLWAGHFMFNLEVGTRVRAPGDCNEIITILTNTDRKPGDISDWPYLTNKDGDLYRGDISREKNVNGFE